MSQIAYSELDCPQSLSESRLTRSPCRDILGRDAAESAVWLEECSGCNWAIDATGSRRRTDGRRIDLLARVAAGWVDRRSRDSHAGDHRHYLSGGRGDSVLLDLEIPPPQERNSRRTGPGLRQRADRNRLDRSA